MVAKPDSTHNPTTEQAPRLIDANSIAEWMTEVQEGMVFLDQVSPSPNRLPFEALRRVIPTDLWRAAKTWRDVENVMHEADVALNRWFIALLDEANTTEDVDRTANLIYRFMLAAGISTCLHTPADEYVAYRARWRREEVLTGMDYSLYLRTDHWQAVRKAAHERAGGRCQVCNSDAALHVHHRTYQRRGRELPEDVIVLCANCHKLFHDNRRLAR